MHLPCKTTDQNSCVSVEAILDHESARKCTARLNAGKSLFASGLSIFALKQNCTNSILISRICPAQHYACKMLSPYKTVPKP